MPQLMLSPSVVTEAMPASVAKPTMNINNPNAKSITAPVP